MSRERDDRRDRESFADLAAGTAGALAELYDRHATSLLRHGLALTKVQADAEDLVHAVFVKLATTGAELSHVASPAAYMHRMLHTTWIDARKRMTLAERAREPLPGDFRWPRPAAPAKEDAIDIARALDDLPPVQRQVVVLHLVEGFSFREIGQATGVSLFTAAARYRLAIARIRRTLKRPGGDRA